MLTEFGPLYLLGDELRRGDVVRVGNTTKLAKVRRIERTHDYFLISTDKGQVTLNYGKTAQVVIWRVK